jgi:putative cell wall-binding protein
VALAFAFAAMPGLAVAATFNANTVISDACFVAPMMSEAEVQAFLNTQPGKLKTLTTTDHLGVSMPAARIISMAGARWGVSPKVILATLQKEQGLLSATSPSASQLSRAMGCGIFVGTTNTYSGFGAQVWHGTMTLHNGAAEWKPGVSLSVAGGTVTPTNAPTWALYEYTPSRSGNQLFSDVYWRYFGDPLASSVRLYGANRFDTAVAIQREAHPDFSGMADVVIASGEDSSLVDALSASGLCWAYKGAPLLLTSKKNVPSSVLQTLGDIYAANGAIRIHVVGGPPSVPAVRVAEMRAYLISRFGASASAAITTERIAGRDRSATAVAVRAKMIAVRGGEMPQEAFLANGRDVDKFVDALAAAAASSRSGIPVLLVSHDVVPADTRVALASYPKDGVHVMGADPTVSIGLLRSLGLSDANRIAGANRYATAVAMAQLGTTRGWFNSKSDALVSASLPDALSGGGMGAGPILYCLKDRLPGETASWLNSKVAAGQLGKCYVLGSSSTVSNATKVKIDIAVQ